MSHDIIFTFLGSMAFALVLGYVAIRLGLSPIVGYIIAGVLAGPHFPGYTANASVAEQFAEIGIILLMFGVGLNFHLKELISVWKVAIPGALFQSLISTCFTYYIMRLLGWTSESALVTGLALSVASTVVLIRILTDHKDLNSRVGTIAVGWVVVEDLLTVLILVALPAIAHSKSSNGAGLIESLALASLGMVLFILAVGLLGDRIIPWILEKIHRTRSRELFMLATLTVALGLAVIATQGFGVSMALGAFMAGLIVARSDYSARAAKEALPMRDVFAVLFFVSVGLLFNPKLLFSNPLPALILAFIVIIIKPLAAALIMWIAREPKYTPMQLGITLGQIGEFTFVLGTAARGLGLINAVAWNSLVAAAMLSIALNPSFYRKYKLKFGLNKKDGAEPRPDVVN
jgi:CPA2 family monovalent cation:H+ antiporter-2